MSHIRVGGGTAMMDSACPIRANHTLWMSGWCAGGMGSACRIRPALPIAAVRSRYHGQRHPAILHALSDHLVLGDSVRAKCWEGNWATEGWAAPAPSNLSYCMTILRRGAMPANSTMDKGRKVANPTSCLAPCLAWMGSACRITNE